MRLTGSNVSKLTLPDGKNEKIVFDDALPGFGVRLRAGGKRVWIAQYRVGSKQRRLTIGSVEKLTADAARSHAKEVLAKVQLGADPQQEKVSARTKASVTLGSVADDYLVVAKGRLRPRSYEEVDRHFRQHWKPLRDVPMHKLDRADIASRLKAIAKDSGPFASNRARASLSSLFSWAMREGIVDSNPVIGTNKATDEVSRDRVLSDDELALVWRHAGEGDYGRIIRLLILTGQRREEVGGMLRNEIQPTKAMWSLPRERTKNGLPHDIPLASAALAIVADVPLQRDREFVFGTGEGAFQGWSNAKAALDSRIKTTVEKQAMEAGERPRAVPPWRLHDIRRTMATRLGDLGVLPHVVEAILNHVSGAKAGVAGIYNRATYAAEKRSALDRWAIRVQELVGDSNGG